MDFDAYSAGDANQAYWPAAGAATTATTTITTTDDANTAQSGPPPAQFPATTDNPFICHYNGCDKSFPRQCDLE